MARYDDLEGRVNAMIEQLTREFGDLGGEMRWSIARALVHRAVHFSSDGGAQSGVEFCALATYLGEMVGHAHKLAHGDNPKAPVHKDFVH